MTSFRGVSQIVSFNRDLYALAAVTIGAGLLVGVFTTHLAALLGLGIACAATAMSVTSTFVSWWIYDRSGLSNWQWLTNVCLPAPHTIVESAADGDAGGSVDKHPLQWVNVHAGFDEAGSTLAKLIGPPAAELDISLGLAKPSRSLRHARQRHPSVGALACHCAHLPVASNSTDAVFVIFAAHELRSKVDRDALFKELHRITRHDGRVSVVEHLRDNCNFLAFGPGAFHFFCARDWKSSFAGAGFSLSRELKQTPFVKGWVLCRS